MLSFPLTEILLVLIVIWLLVLTFFFWQSAKKYRHFTKGLGEKDLMTALSKLLKDFELKSKQIEELSRAVEKTKKDNLYNVQKIGLVRFNPFAGTGGNQSFCLSILDGEDSGLVISSLHSRDTTRIYAKPVKKGKAEGYELSVEEVQAIKNAK